MYKILLVLFFTSVYGASPMPTGDSVVPNDVKYYKHKIDGSDVEIIYSKNNLPFAKKTAKIEKVLNDKYEDIYRWKYDETLYVGLISEKNQIANGFSTQWPNNRQINYIGGSAKVDYFCSTSWLTNLIYHESSHNYQVNLKNNVVSQYLHYVFGNGVVFLPLPLILPNVAENPLMFEGNAVLNESWHGNGGRLYSGRLKAETIMQAKAGNLKAKYLYNRRLGFPYGDIEYVQGSFYHLYLAKKYGLKATNSYFTYHSQYWYWPFLTNKSMQEAVGVDFEDTIAGFEKEQLSLLKDFKILKGKKLISSQYYYPLNSDDKEIYFITNETGVRVPTLVKIDKKTKDLKKEERSFRAAKVIKLDGKYYTQSGVKISPTFISQGLFDDEAFIKEGTSSKLIQGYLSNAKAVYFDVNSSFDMPQLYVGESFYETVNSSVFIDKDDNLYYFKQDKKSRTLYKNKKPLYTYKGFYGFVVDVDKDGKVYFIANSKLGSTLYRWSEDGVFRVNSADNIVDAKLLNSKEVLAVGVGEDEYYYTQVPIAMYDEKPYDTHLFFEDKDYYNTSLDINYTKSIDLDDSYNSLVDMHYSGVNIALGYSDTSGFIGSANINFSDPLAQNSANLFISRDTSEVSIAGAGYESSRYLLHYNLIAYGVVDKPNLQESRDYGVMVNATLPFYTSGYYYGALSASFYQDYDTKEREPLSFSFMFQKSKRFGVSMYPNYLNSLRLYGVSERGDGIVGGSYEFSHDIVDELYIGFKTKYSFSDATKRGEERGVKFSSYSYSVDMDPSTIDMPSMSYDAYVKRAGYAELNLAKVTNFSAYFFTFPLSLQRESFYAKYRYYDIKDIADVKWDANEVTFGVRFASVVLNSYNIPINIEYIYNDAEFTEDKTKVTFSLGIEF